MADTAIRRIGTFRTSFERKGEPVATHVTVLPWQKYSCISPSFLRTPSFTYSVTKLSSVHHSQCLESCPPHLYHLTLAQRYLDDNRLHTFALPSVSLIQFSYGALVPFFSTLTQIRRCSSLIAVLSDVIISASGPRTASLRIFCIGPGPRSSQRCLPPPAAKPGFRIDLYQTCSYGIRTPIHHCQAPIPVHPSIRVRCLRSDLNCTCYLTA